MTFAILGFLLLLLLSDDDEGDEEAVESMTRSEASPDFSSVADDTDASDRRWLAAGEEREASEGEEPVEAGDREVGDGDDEERDDDAVERDDAPDLGFVAAARAVLFVAGRLAEAAFAVAVRPVLPFAAVVVVRLVFLASG